MDNKIKNYIFDLDGTIINSSAEVLKCFEKAFRMSDYPIDKNRLTSDVIGPPLKEIIQNIAPELKDETILNNIIQSFRSIYDNDINDSSVLYNGIREKLDNLKKGGKKLYLATLKPTKPTWRILESYNINIFDDVYTIDKYDKLMTKKEMLEDIIKKHCLKKEETVMIGDAPSDVISAKEAGILGVGVMWGYGSDKTNLIKNSDYVLNCAEEI